MAERPEDYIPPKHRAVQAEALKAVEEAVTLDQAVDPKVTDYATLGSQAILKYAEAACRHIEQVGDEMYEEGKRNKDECYQLAEDMRFAARQQAAAVEAATSRAKQAALSIGDVRKAYRDSMAKERAEAEALKQRAQG
jgi:polyhydroxyalkanoate synthesis regulator phasin